MTRVAQLYYVEKQTQTAISKHLDISQATISRLLRRAHEEEIVRIAVTHPRGTFLDLEEQLRSRFGLTEAVVVEAHDDNEESILSAIGAGTAFFVANSLRPGEIIGISSWSTSLLKTVEAMQKPHVSAAKVIQLLGGTGLPNVEKHATHLTLRLSQITGAEPELLAAPGLTQTPGAAEVLRRDPYVQSTLSQFKNVTLALLGIGALEPSKMLADSGNRLTPAELRELGAAGAVGDMGLRFFDKAGRKVRSSYDARIIGIDLAEIRAIPRVVGVAGGARKVEAIRAAMIGKLIKILVTDNLTAAAILRAKP